jgi:outer membrane lipoprotein carrier protein
VSFVLLILSLSFSAVPQQGDARSIARALEARYRHAATLKAVFFQRYTDGNGGSAAESGVVYFSRPGRMRWEYQSPETKLFLVDGTNVWFYVPADHTASRAKMKESSDWRTPIAVLAGKADLGQLCRKLEIVKGFGEKEGDAKERPIPGGNAVLRCEPRSSGTDDPFREVLLETDPESHLVRARIREVGNVETEFRFGGWEENVAIPEAKFHFEVPAGVAVVDEASLADAIH